MAETSKPPGEQSPTPPGGGAAERRREFLAAREDLPPKGEDAENERDREENEARPGDPTAG